MNASERYPNLHVLGHPLILHKLTHMRDQKTSTKTFRQVLLGGIAWTLHNVDAEVPPNVAQVTPEALAAKK